MPFLKNEAAQTLIAEIDRLERQSDTCRDGLDLLRKPWNLAGWVSLAECMRRIESELPKNVYGGIDHRIVVMNVSRAAAQLCRWCLETADSRPVPRSRFRWSVAAGRDANRAFEVAYQYEHFCSTFPAWHHFVYAADVVGDNRIRFSSQANLGERRVSAHQKGILPPEARKKPESTDRTVALDSLVQLILQESRSNGVLGFRPTRRQQMFEMLFGMYEKRLDALFRRFPQFDIGGYNLADFRRFYAALLSITGTQDYLCFVWAGNHSYPLDSSVIVKSKVEWTDLVSQICGIDKNVVSLIISDLVFDRSTSHDLHVQPFVPLDRDQKLLAIAPPFVLSSNWEENILRTCSYVRPRLYSETTRTKENEMRDLIKAKVAFPMLAHGPYRLLKHLPDVDLVVEDSRSNSILFAELKWLRKPQIVQERIQQDKELLKGVRQAKTIRAFLDANGDFLPTRHRVTKPLSQYSHIYHCVIARDHLLYHDPQDLPIFEFEAFVQALQSANDLESAVEQMIKLDWLPVEERDFKVEFIPSIAAGVTIELETYFPQYRLG